MKSRKLIAVLIAVFFTFAGLASAPVSADKLRWKMASWFPKNLTQLGTLGLHVTETLDRVSGGEIELKYFEPAHSFHHENVSIPLRQGQWMRAGRLPDTGTARTPPWPCLLRFHSDRKRLNMAHGFISVVDRS